MNQSEKRNPVTMKRIKAASLLSTTVEQIKSYIVESGLKAGDMLPTEKVLEEQLGISRTSIREALRSLEALGIVESRHGVGRLLRDFNYDALVAHLTYNIEVNLENFRDVIDVRMALEHSFLERLVPTFSDTDIEELHSILDSLEYRVKHDFDEEELIQLHADFHLRLYKNANNVLLSHLIRMFATIQRGLTIINEFVTPDKEEFIAQHRRLVDAIEAGDTNLVMQRLHEQFKDVIAWNERRST